jgi:hypothetical protein
MGTPKQPPYSKSFTFHSLLLHTLFLFILGWVFTSCSQDGLQPVAAGKPKITRAQATPFDDVSNLGLVQSTEVTVREITSGYIAKAKCTGVIPSGEYAGQRFIATIYGEYSGLGPGTLVTGSAEVKIRSERFESVYSEELVSFCCGEGYILDMGTHYEFVVFGQVVHDGHNHLFAGLGSTLNTMNINVADQTGSITEPAPGGPPPHDPGIGLIIDIKAHPVTVEIVP